MAVWRNDPRLLGLILGLPSTAALAHPGHGGEGLGPWHYLATPEHAAGLGLLAALVVGVLAIRRAARRRRQ